MSGKPRPAASYQGQGRENMKQHRGCAILVLCLILGVPSPSLAADSLNLAFAADAVVVSALEPGAQVVYFSISRSSEGFIPQTRRDAEILRDEDLDGVLRVPLAGLPPVKFLAVAVELESGRFGVLTPAGSPAIARPFPGRSVLSDRLDQLADDRRYVELLVVRPGSGGWCLSAGDGSPVDLSPASDGVILTAVDAMEPIGSSPPAPDACVAGDVVVRVAPRRMEYYAGRLEP